MSGERTFDSGVLQSAATLPEPPDYWSYSTLKEVEACPRQYVLGRASYPELWDRPGYPQQPHPAALFGDVVHDSLERIIKALVRAGCASSNSAEAVAVLRELGGYSAVAAGAVAAGIMRLAGNPRIDDDRLDRLQRNLEDRVPEARTEIQGYLQRMKLVPKPTSTHGGQDGHMPVRRPLGIGSHAEATLRCEDLRVKGRVDLITVDVERVAIVDHKTGAPDPTHLDQLRFYAMLWERDEVANADRTTLGALTASYPTHEEAFPSPGSHELAALVAHTASRVSTADENVLAEVPVAQPGDACTFCSVRGLCDVFWREVAPDPAKVSRGAWFDFDGIVTAQNGAKSWWMRQNESDRKVLLRAPSGRQLTVGQHLRILGVRREDDPEVAEPIATLTNSSEAFVVINESD